MWSALQKAHQQVHAYRQDAKEIDIFFYNYKLGNINFRDYQDYQILLQSNWLICNK